MSTRDNSGALALTFDKTAFELIYKDGKHWVRASQIGQALGYSDPARAVHKLYARNEDEFTEDMSSLLQVFDLRGQSDHADPTCVLELSTQGDPQLRLDSPDAGPEAEGPVATPGQTREVRLFSARGAHLLAMFARTERAKQFRRWVLDVLEDACNRKEPEQLSAMQELSLITKSVQLMDRVERATNLERAEELYLRLMRVNRRLGMHTMAFSALAVSWRQPSLPMQGGGNAPPAPPKPPGPGAH